MSESGKHSRSAKPRSRAAKPRSRPVVKRRGLALTVVAAAAVGCLSYVFYPSTGASPVADRLTAGSVTSQSLAGVLGSGSVSSPDQLPASIVTATANAPTHRRKPGPVHTAAPTAPAATPPATSSSGGGTSFADAGGLGIYDGKFSPSGIETAASWLGSSSSIKYAEDFIDATSWSSIDDPWQLANWKGSPYKMVWGVPMLPCGSPSTQCSTNESDFDQVASGGADSYFKTLAQNLVANGFGSSYIRLGWEMNGSWMGWSICNQSGTGLASWASDFVPAFQNIVTSMRSVSGESFKFIWNPDDSSNASCAGANLASFYPGDSYVDDVALDAYDGVGSTVSSEAARFSDLAEGVTASDWTAVKPAAISSQSFTGYGLDWLAAFAKEHDKEASLPEWGLFSTDTSGGGGDDAAYITQMANWIKANGTGPSIFWNFGDGTLPLDIPNYTSGGTPDATAAFQAAFGT
jgi:hypothetical protein